MTYIERLNGMGACTEAVEWCRGYRTLQVAWDACDRGDWMLWLLGKMEGPSESASRRKLVLRALREEAAGVIEPGAPDPPGGGQADGRVAVAEIVRKHYPTAPQLRLRATTSTDGRR